jgi:hypothetical protein
MNSALAAEGRFLLKTGILPRRRFSRAAPIGLVRAFSQMGKRLLTNVTVSAVPQKPALMRAEVRV